MPGFFIGPGWRMLSPSCGSILITSAPSSASTCVANGPMTTVVRSRTFTPCNGPGIGVISLFWLDVRCAGRVYPRHRTRDIHGIYGREPGYGLARYPLG